MSTETKIKGKLKAQGGLNISGQTPNTVPVINGTNDVVSSAVTSTELGYLSGVMSPIQDQIDLKLDAAEVGVSVASLVGGKVPAAQLPNAIMEYQGNWDASTNTPTLANGAGNADEAIGNVYRVSVAGTVDFGAGPISFEVSDYAILNSAKIWEKADTTDSVFSVNGQQGTVVLDTDDIAEGTTNLYHTAERAQDAVGGILTDTASVDLAYDDTLNAISATVLPAGVDHDALMNFVANEHVDHSMVEIQTAANSGLAGGGDITASRSLVVDITGTTELTMPAADDEILIWDSSAMARRKISRANFLAGSGAANTDELPEGTTNLYFTVERAQDAVATALTDSASVDFTYDDTANTITAAVLPAGVDHDALMNFVANEHVDHSMVEIATASGTSGLSGGGDITTTRNLMVDITGTTALASNVAPADEILVWDVSASALKKATRSELLGGAATSPGDLAEGSFSIANNQVSPADITGFAFDNAVVRSFNALVSVEIDATSDLFESFTILGIQKGSSWDISVISTGDDSGIVFSITALGQLQYTSANLAGFSTGAIKYRASTTSK